MPVVQKVFGREILDSRGRPTLKAYCVLSSGTQAASSVPSGASTGAAEAIELRDGDLKRYRGLGCLRAKAGIDNEISQALSGRHFENQAELDKVLCDLDGTVNKSRLGANAILAVSLAFARTTAIERNVPLFVHFADVLGVKPRFLPRPTINLFSGGKHAGGQVEIQDVLLVPVSARSIDEALSMTYSVYYCAAELTSRKYGMRLLRADEGGLAPPARGSVELLENAVAAIEKAGLKPGSEMALAVDVASSHFHRDGTYHFGGEVLSSGEFIETLAKWIRDFPIISVEDGLAEDDWTHWPALSGAFGERVMVLGDDLLCTNPGRICRAIESRAANALLLKVNQIGTLSEAAEAFRLARNAGWRITVSARSGETEDDWLADLAVGWGGDQIKIGSITQSERLAKYNRLLEIETETGLKLQC